VDADLNINIPFINLNTAYTTLKDSIQIEVTADVTLLNNQTATIDSDLSCKTLWEDNITALSVSLSSDNDATKNFTAYRYDDKCLFFRGNSFIIEYDSGTNQAQSLYYVDNNYETYALFRKFTDNLASAKSDHKWRNAYGVMENNHGNVTCTSADNCTDLVISTTIHCENLFEALTGTGSSTMNSTVSVPEDDVCLFEEDTLNTQLFYYAESGEILFKEKVIEIPTIGNFYLQDPSLDSYDVFQGEDVYARVQQWYVGAKTDAELSNVRVGYYLSTDELLSGDDVFLDDDSSSLGSDDTHHNESQSLTIPITTVPGNYFIIFATDYQKNFVETDENDNWLASPLTVNKK
jgi:hypothetical protein